MFYYSASYPQHIIQQLSSVFFILSTCTTVQVRNAEMMLVEQSITELLLTSSNEHTVKMP